MAVELNIQSNSRQAQDDIRRLRTSVEGIQTQAQNSVTAFRNLGRAVQFAFAAFAGGAVTSSFTRAADEARRINTQLRLVTQTAEEFAVAQRDINRIAIRNRIETEGLATVYNRLARAGQALGRSQAETAIATESIARAVQISGASSESANAAIIQLGQGLAAGQLRGEELNSVLEQTPRIAQIIADELGITTGQLRALAAEGQITSDVVFNALVNQSETIAREFAQVETTVSSAFTVFGIGIRSVLVALDEAGGLTEGLANRLITVGEYLNDFGNNFDRNIELIESRFLRLSISARQFVASFANFSLVDVTFSVTEITAKLEDLRSRAGQIVVELVARLPGQELITQVLDIARQIREAAQVNFEIAIDFLGLNDTLNYVRQWARDVYDAAYQLWVDLVGASIIPDIVDGIIAEFRRVGQALQPFLDFVGRVRDASTELLRNILNIGGTQDVDVEIGWTFADLASGIRNQLSMLPEFFVSIGTDAVNLANSVIAGINNITESDSQRIGNALAFILENVLVPIKVSLVLAANGASDLIDNLSERLDTLDLTRFAENAAAAISTAIDQSIARVRLSLFGGAAGLNPEPAEPRSLLDQLGIIGTGIGLIGTTVGLIHNILEGTIARLDWTTLATGIAALATFSSTARGLITGSGTGAATIGQVGADILRFPSLERARTQLQALEVALSQVAGIESSSVRDYNAALASQAEIQSRLSTATREQNEAQRRLVDLRRQAATLNRNDVEARNQLAAQIREQRNVARQAANSVQTLNTNLASATTSLNNTRNSAGVATSSINATDAAVRRHSETLRRNGTTANQAAESLRRVRASLQGIGTQIEEITNRASARAEAFIGGGGRVGGQIGGAAGGAAGFTLAQGFIDALEESAGDIPAWAEAGISIAGGFAGQVTGQAFGTAVGTVLATGITSALATVGATALAGFGAAVATAITGALAIATVVVSAIFPEDFRNTVAAFAEGIGFSPGTAQTIADILALPGDLIRAVGTFLGDAAFVAIVDLPRALREVFDGVISFLRDTANSVGIALGTRVSETAAGNRAETLAPSIEALRLQIQNDESLSERTRERQLDRLSRIEEYVGDSARSNTEVAVAIRNFGSQNREQTALLRDIRTAFNEGQDVGAFNTGGAVRGPGSGTSDSILARVSNGEYVIRASSVSKYGTRFLDALNNGAIDRSITALGPVLGFARGGQIGRYQGGGLIGSNPAAAIASEIAAALDGTLRPTLEEIVGLSTNQLELLASEVNEITQLQRLLAEGNLTALQTESIQRQIADLQENIAGNFARGSTGASTDGEERQTPFTIQAAAQALGGFNEFNLALAATDEQLRQAIDLETQRAELLSQLRTNENLTLEQRRMLVAQLDELNEGLEDLAITIDNQVPGIRRAREEYDFFAANLSSDLARSLSQGNFNDVGEVVRTSLLRSLQSRLQTGIEENLNTIFEQFGNQLFNSLQGSLASTGGAGGGGFNFGSLFSSVGSFFGGFFHSGGIVPGSGDVPIIAQGGEAVLTQEQQRALFDSNGQQSSGGRPPQVVNINVSGNVDQRAIDQIRSVILSSPEQVGTASSRYQQDTRGLTRRG